MNADQEKQNLRRRHGGTEEKEKPRKPLKHRGTEVAEENDLLAISSDSADIRVDPRLGLASFSDVGDDARCRRFLERFDGLNGHSIDFTRLQKSRHAGLKAAIDACVS